ncbi:hypothetical protein SAMN04489724_3263 [Algoriphagus locisalis]|uniref:Uncharacterized protein n=2 Tax=Algoriphagus locisalis TaxID=305507 RepID=A0A1I7CJK7_9BACT|nr:hypothetical protein SAMN04489724_3263 [Algoriphagus locisalis]
MRERCRWGLAILLGIVMLTANRELGIIHSVWVYLKEMAPNLAIFLIVL